MTFSLYKSRRATTTEMRKLIKAADQHRDSRRWKMAEESYAQALKLDGSLAHIWVQYGHALKESGDPAKALTAYKRALELQPKVADTALQIAHCVKILGDVDQAKSWYLKAMDLDPFEFRAEAELKFLDVPLELHIPDLEKRRLRLENYALAQRTVFLCTASRDFLMDDGAGFRNGLIKLAFENDSERPASIGICEMSAGGILKILLPPKRVGDEGGDTVGNEVPECAAVIVPLDTFLDIDGFAAALLEAALTRKIIPILLVDKLITKRAAELLLAGKEASFLAARSLSLLTLAIDSDSVDILDGVASAGSLPLSSILNIARARTLPTATSVGNGPVTVILRDLDSPNLSIVLSMLRSEFPNFVLLAECAPRQDCVSEIETIPAYSRKGMETLASASLVLIMDDCADTNLWIATARKSHRPVVTGLVEPTLRIWGNQISDFIDFSQRESMARLPDLVGHVNLPDTTETDLKDDLSSSRDCWHKILSYSWVGHDGIPIFRLGEFHAFNNGMALCFGQTLLCADRFRFGSNWIVSEASLDPADDWRLAGRVVNGEISPPIMHLLVQNDSDTGSVVRWASSGGEEVHLLKAGQRVWMTISSESLDGVRSGVHCFKWNGEKAGCRPLGFVVTTANQNQSWSGFLDRIDHGYMF
jgi:tetratricopeptide (TPR) repeat protein